MDVTQKTSSFGLNTRELIAVLEESGKVPKHHKVTEVDFQEVHGKTVIHVKTKFRYTLSKESSIHDLIQVIEASGYKGVDVEKFKEMIFFWGKEKFIKDGVNLFDYFTEEGKLKFLKIKDFDFRDVLGIKKGGLYESYGLDDRYNFKFLFENIIYKLTGFNILPKKK